LKQLYGGEIALFDTDQPVVFYDVSVVYKPEWALAYLIGPARALGIAQLGLHPHVLGALTELANWLPVQERRRVWVRDQGDWRCYREEVTDLQAIMRGAGSLSGPRYNAGSLDAHWADDVNPLLDKAQWECAIDVERLKGNAAFFQ